jgi:hypothetical protein
MLAEQGLGADRSLGLHNVPDSAGFFDCWWALFGNRDRERPATGIKVPTGTQDLH